MKLRNVAIIAHVDHGKTTLVDAMLGDAGTFRENEERVDCVLDSNELERERGITVLAKNCSVTLGDLKVNIIDTPGHADFGGEVERTLRMADGALLLVDAFEGPMPQTRYVLRKALAAGLRVVVVVNKCDRRDARPDAVLDEVFDLFVDLGANDEQLDFPVIWASGRMGWTRHELDDGGTDTRALIEVIERSVPAPKNDSNGPVRLQVANIDHSHYVGRVAIGRVERGVLRRNESLVAMRVGGTPRPGKVTGLYVFDGLGRRSVESVSAGDLVAIEGFPDVSIGETLCHPAAVEPLEEISIDEPTVALDLLVNDSPFSGKEGKFVTGRQISERLKRELRSNVALKVEESGEGRFRVSGRGVMHLGILLETMRREGYEVAVSRPRVIDRYEDGKRLEPVEDLYVDVPTTEAGKVLEIVGSRRGELAEMTTEGVLNRLHFVIPARGIIGLRTKVLNATRGEAVISHILRSYEPYKGEIQGRAAGALCCSETGRVSNYSLDNLQDRGTFFVAHASQVYEGQVVGEHCREGDITVNVCRDKKLTNMRTSGTDRALKVAPPREFSLEDALEWIGDDELVEITPKALRMRKSNLNALERKRAARSAASA